MSTGEEYDVTRSLVALVRLIGEEDARTCAAMLSVLEKAEARGEPVPGYVALLGSAKARA